MRRLGVLLTAVTLVVIAALGSAAGAHTAMLRGSPDRNAVVGGAIDAIDLEFLDPVTETVVTVSYNGTPLAGQTPVADGEIITHALARPLVEAGRYQVSYEMISADGDFTTGGYFFTFDPTAPPPPRIQVESGSGGFSIGLLPVLIGLCGLAGVLGLLVWWSGRRRHPLILDASESDQVDPRHY